MFLKFATMKYPGASLPALVGTSVTIFGGCRLGADMNVYAPWVVNAPIGVAAWALATMPIAAHAARTTVAITTRTPRLCLNTSFSLNMLPITP